MKKKLLDDNTLALGEQTGHRHAAEGAQAVYEYENRVREFDARSGEVIITHQEHQPIQMPAKVMRSGRVREFDSFAEAARDVRD